MKRIKAKVLPEKQRFKCLYIALMSSCLTMVYAHKRDRNYLKEVIIRANFPEADNTQRNIFKKLNRMVKCNVRMSREP